MISILGYLRKKSCEGCEALERANATLVQGIGLHAVSLDEAEKDEFQRSLKRLEERFQVQTSPESVFLLTGAVNSTLEEYNRHATQTFRAQNAHTNEIIAMLSKTLGDMAGDESLVERVKKIEKLVHQAGTLDDLMRIKTLLGEDLRAVRDTFERQRTETLGSLSQMKERLQTVLVSRRGGAPAVVERTGPKDERAEAEGAIAQTFLEKKKASVAIFILDRLGAISDKYGPAVGDQVIVFFADHLGGKLTTKDRLFRWGGPVFLALLERDSSIQQVHREVSMMISHRLDFTVKVGNRDALLPVVAKWFVISLRDVDSAAAALVQIDKVIETQHPDEGSVNRPVSRGASLPATVDP